MHKRSLTLLAGLAGALALAGPGAAHNAGPCEQTGDPGHSEYAHHHIVFMAQDGPGLNDPDEHAPGIHRGYSFCNPSDR